MTLGTLRSDNGNSDVGLFFTSGCVLRMSIFLRRRFPFTRGRQQALFDVALYENVGLLCLTGPNRGKRITVNAKVCE